MSWALCTRCGQRTKLFESAIPPGVDGIRHAACHVEASWSADDPRRPVSAAARAAMLNRTNESTSDAQPDQDVLTIPDT